MCAKRYRGSRTERRRTPASGSFALLRDLPEQTPIADLSPEELATYINSAIRTYNDEFPRLLEALDIEVQRTDPVLLLSVMALTQLFGTPDWDPESEEDFPILQPDVELLQGIILRHAENAFALHDPNLPSHLHNIEVVLKRAGMLFFMRRWQPVDVPVRPASGMLGEMTRVHTQGVRNWGYPEQIQRIVATLFAPLEDQIEETLGVRIGPLTTMGYKIIEKGEQQLNGMRRAFEAIRNAPTPRKAYEAFVSFIPDGGSPSLRQLMESPAYPLGAAQELLIQQWMERLPLALSFTVSDFVKAYPKFVEPNVMHRIMVSWSMGFGDTADRPVEYLFMGNPIWTKPMIRLPNDLFFFPILAMFNSWCLNMMEALIQPHPPIRNEYQPKARTDFLEQETSRLFLRAFPGSELYQDVHLPDTDLGGGGESDIILLVDSGIVVVEAKSGRVGETARRGDPVPLRNAIDKLVTVPFRQADRFVRYLHDNPGIHRLGAKNRTARIDSSAIKWAVTLATSLEESAAIHLRWRDLVDDGIVPATDHPVPVVSLPDLEAIFIVLPGPIERLHYLARRSEVEMLPGYAGSELDLLAFYLDTGFDDELAATDQGSGLFGRYKGLDRYLRQYFAGEKAQRFERAMTTTWRRMVRWLEQQRPPRWTEIGCLLLDVSQVRHSVLEQQWARADSVVRSKRRFVREQHTVEVITGRRGSIDALVLLSHGQIDHGSLLEVMRVIGQETGRQIAARRAIVVARDARQPDRVLTAALCVDIDLGQSGSSSVPYL